MFKQFALAILKSSIQNWLTTRVYLATGQDRRDGKEVGR